MTIIAPSSVSPAIAPMVPDALRGNVMQENFQRQQAGDQRLTGHELDQFVQRGQQDLTRQAQIQDLDAALDDRSVVAEEMANDLMQSGMADVAERFRRASRRQAFNAARRGLAGGSAAIEQQQQQQAQARQEAQDVIMQGEQSVAQQALKAQQERDRLARAVLSENPYLRDAEATRGRGIQQETDLDARIAAARQQEVNAKLGAQLGMAGVIGTTLGSLGEVGGQIAERSA